MSTQNGELSKKELNEQLEQHNKEINARLDENYDGYYDDIKPQESHSKVQDFNKEMAKKIAFIVVGALGIIALAVLLLVF